MDFDVLDGRLVITVSMLGTLALALFSYFLGAFIRSRVLVFVKLSMPAPVIGGLIFCVTNSVLTSYGILTIELSRTVQTLVMIAFMCSIGLMGSFALIRKGGLLLLAFWLAANVLGALQNILGATVAAAFGLPEHIGFLAGGVSLMGGIGVGAAFGPFFEEAYGITGAIEIAVACGTFGILIALMFGAPFGQWLISRYKLAPESFADTANGSTHKNSDIQIKSGEEKASASELLRILGLVFAAALVGDLINLFLQNIVTVPVYLAGILCAIVLRNVCDGLKICTVEGPGLRVVSSVTLSIYVSLAVNKLMLYELVDLALPLAIIMIAQVVLALFFCWLVVFNLFGRNYVAALLSVGMMGFGLGITANGLTNMQSLTEKYGGADKVFFIVAIVGTALIDSSNTFIVTGMAAFLE